MTDTPPTASGPLRCMALHGGIVYGPIRSRRFGTSLGINLLPANHKVCSFNCVYCQYGWTQSREADPVDRWPDPREVAAAVRQAALQAVAGGTRLDRWTLAGHGEPTLHPEFPAVVEGLRRVRAEVAPATPIGILSNSTTAHVPAIRHALGRLDERGMKLDAATQDGLRQVNAASIPVEQIVDALAALPDIVVQAMFVREPRGRVDNTTPAAVAAWTAAVARIHPREVQIYTLARLPAWERLQAVPRQRLEEIAAGVQALGIPAAVFN